MAKFLLSIISKSLQRMHFQNYVAGETRRMPYGYYGQSMRVRGRSVQRRLASMIATLGVKTRRNERVECWADHSFARLCTRIHCGVLVTPSSKSEIGINDCIYMLNLTSWFVIYQNLNHLTSVF